MVMEDNNVVFMTLFKNVFAIFEFDFFVFFLNS